MKDEFRPFLIPEFGILPLMAGLMGLGLIVRTFRDSVELSRSRAKPWFRVRAAQFGVACVGSIGLGIGLLLESRAIAVGAAAAGGLPLFSRESCGCSGPGSTDDLAEPSHRPYAPGSQRRGFGLTSYWNLREFGLSSINSLKSL